MASEGRKLRTLEDALVVFVQAARAKFKAGDRVRHKGNGWTGTVTAEPSDKGVVWCIFDGVGQYGADPRQLAALRNDGSGGGVG